MLAGIAVCIHVAVPLRWTYTLYTWTEDQGSGFRDSEGHLGIYKTPGLIITILSPGAQVLLAYQARGRSTAEGASRRAAGLSNQRDLVSRCAERRHNTTLDHYDWVRLRSA